MEEAIGPEERPAPDDGRQRDRTADERESIADQREAQLDAREARLDERARRTAAGIPGLLRSVDETLRRGREALQRSARRLDPAQEAVLRSRARARLEQAEIDRETRPGREQDSRVKGPSGPSFRR